MKINIIFEDNHIIVAEKPFNVPSQKDNSNDEDVLNLLKDDIKKRYNKPGNVYLGLVHRLDRPAGGVMLFARTSKAASRLSAQMRSKELEKKYFAVVHGRMKKKSGNFVHYLVKDTKSNTVWIAEDSNPLGKEAVLDYRVIDYSGELTLVEIDLITGRPHQIRAQFTESGHPLYGDQKYGSGLNRPGQQLALWSHEVSFVHPTSKERLTFRLAPPEKEPWTLFTSLQQS